MKFLQIVFQKYIQTTIEIIETSQSNYLPQRLYIIIYSIFLLQLLSFTYSSDDFEHFFDDKLEFVRVLSEYMSISYSIMKFGKDSLILLWFILLSGITYSFLIYISIITCLKIKFPRFYTQIIWYFERINEKLSIYFTIYPWIFFISFIETNSGILACGQNSFLEKYQNKDNCSEKPIYIYFLTIFALIISLLMCFIVFFFFRNRQFCEKNIIKRRFNFILILITILSFFIVLSYYLIENISPRIKNAISIIIGALYMYDATFNMPFSNIDMNKCVACLSCIFFSCQISLLIWLENPNIYGEYDIFYSTVILSAVFCGVILSIIHIQYDKFLKLQISELQKKSNQQKCVNFLEELYKLGMEYQNDRYCRFKLGEVLAYHQQTCISISCFCRHIQTQNVTEKMISDQIILLVDSLFKQYLENQSIQKNQNEFEYISLKYISFLSKCCNNSMKAYYMLKTLDNSRTKRSFYFQNIQKVMSVQLQEMNAQESLLRNNNLKQINDTYGQTVSVKQIYQTEMLKQQGIQILLKFLEKKKQFYQKLNSGYSSIQDYSKEAIELGKVGEDAKKEMDKILSEKNKRNLDINNNIILLKIQSIYFSLVHKKMQQSLYFEEKAKEVTFKNKQRLVNCQEVISHSQENVEVIEVSLIQNKGKITSNNQKRLGFFFGYDTQELQQKTFEIKDLMPKCISEIHDYLINNMIKRGYSKFSNTRLQTFGKDNQGFIFPISLQIDIQQKIDNDFRLMVSILKLTENQNHIILTNEFGQIEGLTKDFYQKIIQNDESLAIIGGCQNKTKSFCSFKGMSSNKSFKEGRISTYQFNIFLILQTLIDQVIMHQAQISKQKKKDKSINKSIINQEKAIMKIPLNLKKLNQIINYQNKDSSKTDIFQTMKRFIDESYYVITLTKLIKTIFNEIKKLSQLLIYIFFLIINKQEIYSKYINLIVHFIQFNLLNIQEFQDENCMNTYSITYNLNFELLEYEIDNEKREKQLYIIEITEIEQLIEKQDSFQSYDNSDKCMQVQQSSSTKKSSGCNMLSEDLLNILSPFSHNNLSDLVSPTLSYNQFQTPNISYQIFQPNNTICQLILDKNNQKCENEAMPFSNTTLDDKQANKLIAYSQSNFQSNIFLSATKLPSCKILNDQKRMNLSRLSTTERDIQKKLEDSSKMNLPSTTQKLEYIDEEMQFKIDFKNQIQFEINSSCSANSSQRYYSNDVSRLNAQSFLKRVSSYLNSLILSFSVVVVSLILFFYPQVSSVFNLIENNIQHAYITSHLDYTLSHQISNSIIIKLQNNTINYEYSPYNWSYLNSKTKKNAAKYIELIKEGREKLIHDSQALEYWLNSSNQFQVEDVIVLKLQFITNMYDLIHFKSSPNQQMMEVDDSSFNFIIKNLLISKQITSKQLEIQHEDIQNNIIKMERIGYIYAFAFLIMFIIVYVIWLYFIKRVAQVNKRILLLIARASWQECQVEEIKYDYCIQILKSIDQSWINKNFIDIIKFQTTEKTKIISNKKQGRNSIGQIFLSSQIHDQNYIQWRYIFISFIVSISAFIFFGSSILFLNSMWNQINETADLYYKVADQKLAYSTIGLYPDLLASDYIFQQQSKDYPKFKIADNYDFYSKQIDSIKSGIKQFTSDIQSIETLSERNITNIRKIFEQDACFNMKDSFGYCERRNNQTDKATIIGLASEIQEDLQYLSQFKDLLSHTVEDNQKQNQIDLYFNNKQHQNFPRRSFELIYLSLHTIQSILYQSNQSTMNQVFHTFALTLKVITPIMVISWLLICAYLKNNLLSSSKKINFILTCIPFSKLQEDITITMLKKIEQM